ncbi:MAG TPA: hypothetical protein VEJ16_01890 [Alphaproteobacteria bacterium]|nr:hypothetical protein [Alphaproteobacteria bacterium]
MISQTIYRNEEWVAANDDFATSKVESGVVAFGLVAALSLIGATLFPQYAALLGQLF